MQCPKCQFDNPAWMKFCGNCGARLAAALPAQDERRVVSVMFGDVSGFTAMSENLDPEDVKDIMDSCLSNLAEVVREFDGTVDKFGGDSILAYFGYPVAHEDDPERAVGAALAMQQAMGSFNDELETKRGLRLQMRIGINTGLALAGQMGSQTSHQESTIMGDTVNTASRLQALARPGHITVSESTRRATQHRFEFGAAQRDKVKGKVEQVLHYEVIGIRSERASLRGLESRGLAAPMIGRGREMQELQHAYAQAVAGRTPLLATVWGAAGSGKSRLIAEFCATLAQSKPLPNILRGRCLPFGQGNTTYWALGEMVKQECGIRDSDPLAEAQSKLVARLETLLREADGVADPRDAFRIAAYIGVTIGWNFSDRLVEGISAASQREERAWAWRRFFSLKAATAPLVVFFEDIHWADDELLKYIEDLVARSEAIPMLVLCASRPEFREAHPKWSNACNAVSVDLHPLTDEESLDLVNALLVIDELPVSVRDLIIQRADGNPFYIEEIIRLLIEDKKIEQRDGRWVAVAGIAQSVLIPDNVQYLLSARIDRLVPAEQKRVLQEASVIGREFWAGAVTSILDGQISAEAVKHHLAVLVQREMVNSVDHSSFVGEEEYSFRHVLTHDVAYEMLPHRERSHKHRLAAQWLERAAGDRIEEYVERIAYHYGQAVQFSAGAASVPGFDNLDANRTKARHYLKIAGDKSMSLQDFRKAQQFYHDAMDIAFPANEDIELDLNLEISYAQAVFFLGDYNQSELHLQRSAAEARKVHNQAALAKSIELLAEVKRQRGEYEHSIPLYEELIPLYRDMGNIVGESSATSRLALSSVYREPAARVNALAQRAYQLAQASGKLAAQMYALQALTVIYSDVQGDLYSAELISRRLLPLLEELGDRLLISNTLLNLALICYYLGKYEESASRSQQAIDKACELGYSIVDMKASRVLGDALLAMNKPTDAMGHLRHALGISATLDERDVLPEIRRGLAEAHLQLGELDAALEQAAIATTVVLPEDTYSQATTQCTLGMVLAAHGRSDEAEAAFQRSLTLLEGTAYLPVLAMTSERYAAFLTANRRDDAAVLLRDRATTLRQRISTPQPGSEADDLTIALTMPNPAPGPITQTDNPDLSA